LPAAFAFDFDCASAGPLSPGEKQDMTVPLRRQASAASSAP
jgi:hypothetical protein